MFEFGGLALGFFPALKQQTQSGACSPPGYAVNPWRRIHSEASATIRSGPEHPLTIGGESMRRRVHFFSFIPSPTMRRHAISIHFKGESMKRTLIRLCVALIAALFTAVPAFAQGNEGDSNRGLAIIGTVIGFGIAAGLCGIGQGRVAAAACEGMARNPGAYNRVQLALILGLAFIETLVIFTFVVVLLRT
jgi:F-type H+-transporting ATPase subunit c